MQIFYLTYIQCVVENCKPCNMPSYYLETIDHTVKDSIGQEISLSKSNDGDMTHLLQDFEEDIKELEIFIDQKKLELTNYIFYSFMLHLVNLSKDIVLNEASKHQIIIRFYETLVDIYMDNPKDVEVYKYITSTLSNYDIQEEFKSQLDGFEMFETWFEELCVEISNDLNVKLIFNLLKEAIDIDRKRLSEIFTKISSDDILDSYRNYYLRLAALLSTEDVISDKNFKELFSLVLNDPIARKKLQSIYDKAFNMKMKVNKSVNAIERIEISDINEETFLNILQTIFVFGALEDIISFIDINAKIHDIFPEYTEKINLIDMISSKPFWFFKNNTDFLLDIVNIDNEEVAPVLYERFKVHILKDFGNTVIKEMEKDDLKNECRHFVNQTKNKAYLEMLSRDMKLMKYKKPDTIFKLYYREISSFFIREILQTVDIELIDRIINEVKDKIKQEYFCYNFCSPANLKSNNLFISKYFEKINTDNSQNALNDKENMSQTIPVNPPAKEKKVDKHLSNNSQNIIPDLNTLPPINISDNQLTDGETVVNSEVPAISLDDIVDTVDKKVNIGNNTDINTPYQTLPKVIPQQISHEKHDQNIHQTKDHLRMFSEQVSIQEKYHESSNSTEEKVSSENTAKFGDIQKDKGSLTDKNPDIMISSTITKNLPNLNNEGDVLSSSRDSNFISCEEQQKCRKEQKHDISLEQELQEEIVDNNPQKYEVAEIIDGQNPNKHGECILNEKTQQNNLAMIINGSNYDSESDDKIDSLEEEQLDAEKQLEHENIVREIVKLSDNVSNDNNDSAKDICTRQSNITTPASNNGTEIYKTPKIDLNTIQSPEKAGEFLNDNHFRNTDATKTHDVEKSKFSHILECVDIPKEQKSESENLEALKNVKPVNIPKNSFVEDEEVRKSSLIDSDANSEHILRQKSYTHSHSLVDTNDKNGAYSTQNMKLSNEIENISAGQHTHPDIIVDEQMHKHKNKKDDSDSTVDISNQAKESCNETDNQKLQDFITINVNADTDFSTKPENILEETKKQLISDESMSNDSTNENKILTISTPMPNGEEKGFKTTQYHHRHSVDEIKAKNVSTADNTDIHTGRKRNNSFSLPSELLKIKPRNEDKITPIPQTLPFSVDTKLKSSRNDSKTRHINKKPKKRLLKPAAFSPPNTSRPFRETKKDKRTHTRKILKPNSSKSFNTKHQTSENKGETTTVNHGQDVLGDESATQVADLQKNAHEKKQNLEPNTDKRDIPDEQTQNIQPTAISPKIIPTNVIEPLPINKEEGTNSTEILLDANEDEKFINGKLKTKTPSVDSDSDNTSEANQQHEVHATENTDTIISTEKLTDVLEPATSNTQIPETFDTKTFETQPQDSKGSIKSNYIPNIADKQNSETEIKKLPTTGNKPKFSKDEGEKPNDTNNDRTNVKEIPTEPLTSEDSDSTVCTDEDIIPKKIKDKDIIPKKCGTKENSPKKDEINGIKLQKYEDKENNPKEDENNDINFNKDEIKDIKLKKDEVNDIISKKVKINDNEDIKEKENAAKNTKDSIKDPNPIKNEDKGTKEKADIKGNDTEEKTDTNDKGTKEKADTKDNDSKDNDKNKTSPILKIGILALSITALSVGSYVFFFTSILK